MRKFLLLFILFVTGILAMVAAVRKWYISTPTTLTGPKILHFVRWKEIPQVLP